MSEATTPPAAPALFDLGSITAADTVPLTMRHPITRQATTWVLTLAGPGHPETLAVRNEATRERLEEERAKEVARANGRRWDGPEIDPDRDRAVGIARAARRIVGWSPVTINGVPFPYSRENAQALLTHPDHQWAADQIFNAFADDAAFFRVSAPA